MERRELLALAGVLAVAGTATAAAQSSGQELKARLIHIYATPNGGSRGEIIEISNSAGEIPVNGMTARAYERNTTRSEEWHTAPRNQFAINLTGDLEVETTDGERHPIGAGDLVFLSDTTGQGHITRVKSEVTNLFIQVPQDWDMLKWARG
jgi:hypothetical protein